MLHDQVVFPHKVRRVRSKAEVRDVIKQSVCVRLDASDRNRKVKSDDSVGSRAVDQRQGLRTFHFRFRHTGESGGRLGSGPGQSDFVLGRKSARWADVRYLVGVAPRILVDTRVLSVILILVTSKREVAWREPKRLISACGGLTSKSQWLSTGSLD